MIIKWVSLLIFPITIILFITPVVTAIGDFTIGINRAIDEEENTANQTSLTIYYYGTVNYTGYSISGDTIYLSSSSDLGESSVSPTEVTFHSTGTEEFTVEFTIQNNYENGTTVNISVSGIFQQGGTTVVKSAQAQIHLSNHSYPDNGDNLDSLNSHQNNEASSELSPFLMISLIIIVVGIAITIYYRRTYNN